MLSLTAGVPRWMFRPSGTGSYSSLWETPNGPRLSFLLVAVPMQICLGSRLLLCRVPPRLWASTSPTSVWSVDESLFVHLAAYPAGSAAARSSAAEAQRHARSIRDRTAALGMCRLFVLPCLEVVEAAGVEPASESAFPPESTCLSALASLAPGIEGRRKKPGASPEKSCRQASGRRLKASPLNDAQSRHAGDGGVDGSRFTRPEAAACPQLHQVPSD